MSSKGGGTEIISYVCGKQDIQLISSLRASGKVLRWWFATDKFYYEIKK